MPAATPPGSARLHHLLGVALEWCGLGAGAAQAFQDAIRRAPDHAHTWFRLGDTLARSGFWREASEAFREAARRVPESPEYQGNLVLALARAEAWKEAVPALRRLAHLRPHEGEAYVLLGGVLKKLRRHDEAIRAFRWAVRLRPSLSTKRFFLGEALLGEHGWKEAVEAWRQARFLPVEAEPRREIRAGRSSLHAHPGAPRQPGERRTASRRASESSESFEDVLRREERARTILHVYREARPFPIRHGDRPAKVHVSPLPATGPARRAQGEKRP